MYFGWSNYLIIMSKENFWSLCDVVKGIARDGLPFAMGTYHGLTHVMLDTMLEWYVGIKTGYLVSCGKMNKYFKRYLPEEIYDQYLKTYPDSNYEHFWESIEASVKLFRRIGEGIAKECGYTYPEKDEEAFYKYVVAIK